MKEELSDNVNNSFNDENRKEDVEIEKKMTKRKRHREDKTKTLEKSDIDNKEDDINEDGDEKSTIHRNKKRGRIFIRNLPFGYNEAKVVELFSKIGPVSDVRVPLAPDSDRIKGYAFLQYETKKEALTAIKKHDSKKLDGRRLSVTLASTKEQYADKKAQEDLENQEGEEFKKQAKQEKKEQREKMKEKPVCDEQRTLFINNLNFSTEEGAIREFFEMYGKVIYVKIVKNKETQTSKGCAFVMMKFSKDVENLLKIFKKYKETNESGKNDRLLNLNQFEIDGRNINLMSAVSRENAETLKNSESSAAGRNTIRNNHLLYYGIGNNSLLKLEDKEISDDDKAKREALIKMKKDNFKKNPNLHVSNTRITIRNLTKHHEESDIKDMIRPLVEKFVESVTDPEKKKHYEKTKKIKQIKLLRSKTEVNADNKGRSKNCCYVEVIDENLGKYLIDHLNNHKVGPNRGLIVDFALDDIRKGLKREKKLAIQKERLKEKKEEEEGGNEKSNGKTRRKELTKSGKTADDKAKAKTKNNDKASAAPIDKIESIPQLIKLYSGSISRGKKQRIKKKLIKLGYNPQNLPKTFKQRIPKPEEKQLTNASKKSGTYVAQKLDIGNQNLNKHNVDRKSLKRHLRRERNKNKKQEKYTEDDLYADDDDNNNPLFKEIERRLNDGLKSK